MGASAWSQTIAIWTSSPSIIISILVKREYSLSQILTPTSNLKSWKSIRANGRVLKTFNMADIISAAMRAGGDDPSVFVYPSPNDWFHNNGAVYNRADDSLIVSSRENFLICIDYETKAIKWILGDPSKKWYHISVFEKICAHGRAWQPAPDWPTFALDYL